MSSLRLTFRVELLASLRPEYIDARLHNITAPHENTFRWIWSADDLDLVSWLRSGSGLYWISGKPGSGKSTLMKYLYRNEQTELHLRSKSSCVKLIRPNFFFHSRGNKIQKSLEGLLRSFLYQILSSEPELSDTVIDRFGQRLEEERSHWSQQALEEILSLIMGQNTTQISICLFLDALDECDGDPESVASFLRSLVALSRPPATKIKVCFQADVTTSSLMNSAKVLASRFTNAHEWISSR